MSIYLRAVLHTIYAICLLLLFSFSGSKYDWITGMDASISAGAIEDASGSRAVLLGIVLAVSTLTELIVALRTKKALERTAAALLVVVAIATFVARQF